MAKQKDEVLSSSSDTVTKATSSAVVGIKSSFSISNIVSTTAGVTSKANKPPIISLSSSNVQNLIASSKTVTVVATSAKSGGNVSVTDAKVLSKVLTTPATSIKSDGKSSLFEPSVLTKSYTNPITFNKSGKSSPLNTPMLSKSSVSVTTSSRPVGNISIMDPNGLSSAIKQLLPSTSPGNHGTIIPKSVPRTSKSPGTAVVYKPATSFTGSSKTDAKVMPTLVSVTQGSLKTSSSIISGPSKSASSYPSVSSKPILDSASKTKEHNRAVVPNKLDYAEGIKRSISTQNSNVTESMQSHVQNYKTLNTSDVSKQNTKNQVKTSQNLSKNSHSLSNSVSQSSNKGQSSFGVTGQGTTGHISPPPKLIPNKSVSPSSHKTSPQTPERSSSVTPPKSSPKTPSPHRSAGSSPSPLLHFPPGVDSSRGLFGHQPSGGGLISPSTK